MATQTHQLNIKAKLDTSEVRAELERLNQNRGARAEAGGAQGQGAAQRTTQLLSKLDGTLNRLNSVINRLADVVGAKNYGRSAPISMPYNSMPPLALPFDRMNNDQFYNALGQIRAHKPELFGSIAASLSPEEQTVLKYLRPDIFGPETAFLSNKPYNRNFRRQLRSLGLGAISHMAGSQFQSISELMDENSAGKQVVSGFGKFISAAGSGAMAGAAFGPWGAGIGAALMGLSQAAIDTASALKKLEDEALQRTQTARKSYNSAAYGLITANAEYRFNNIDRFDIGKYQTTVDSLQKQRIDLMTAITRETSNPIMDKKHAENLANLQASLQDTEKQLATYESALATLMQRRAETSTEEEEAGKALARAERKFADELIAEERAREQWHIDSQSNIKAYREAQHHYRDQMHQRDIQVAGFERQMDFQRSQAQIRLGMWRGGTAEDYFKEARTKRQSLIVLNAARSHETDPQKLRQLNEDITAMQEEFQHTMMIGQLLKNLGNPLQKMQLGSLTSLANRGVNMGERTEMQRPYDKKMDEMVDLLQNIEENTRAAEKAIWE